MKQCDCNSHYLELKHCDGENFISKRVCYKCGKWWSPLNEKTSTVKRTYNYNGTQTCMTSHIYKYTTYPNYSVLTTGVLHNGEICYLSDVQEFVVNIDGTIMYMK